MKTNNSFVNILYSAAEIEEYVIMVRLDLYNRGVPCGAQAIRLALDDKEINPLPSLSTIGRILRRNGLTYRRTGNYS